MPHGYGVTLMPTSETQSPTHSATKGWQTPQELEGEEGSEDVGGMPVFLPLLAPWLPGDEQLPAICSHHNVLPHHKLKSAGP